MFSPGGGNFRYGIGTAQFVDFHEFGRFLTGCRKGKRRKQIENLFHGLQIRYLSSSASWMSAALSVLLDTTK